jgi:hypothetical protein
LLELIEEPEAIRGAYGLRTQVPQSCIRNKQGRNLYEPVIAMNEKRKRLLIELEDIIGHEFYNAKIQNWGPGGVFEGEGRELRYPVTFHDKDGKTIKTKHVDVSLPAETIMTGVYKVGQNELSIMRALNLILGHLERKHGLNLGKNKN